MTVTPEELLAGMGNSNAPADAPTPGTDPGESGNPNAPGNPGAPAPSPVTGVSPSIADQLTRLASPNPTQDAFRTQVAQNANEAIKTASDPAAPFAWARSLVAGAQTALAGVGNIGEVPKGTVSKLGGAMYGIGKVAQANAASDRQAQQDAAAKKQQAFENSLALSKEARENQEAIAHENAYMAQNERLRYQTAQDKRDEAANEVAYIDKSIKDDTAAMQPMVTGRGAAPTVAENVKTSELQSMIQSKQLDPTVNHAFRTGKVDTGKKNEFGNEIWEPTYTVVGNPQSVKLEESDKDIVDRMNKEHMTLQPLTVGSEMPGVLWGQLTQRLASTETAREANDSMLAKAKLEKANMEGDLAAANILQPWGTALSQNGGDRQAAYKQLVDAKNADGTPKYPTAAGDVLRLFEHKNKDGEITQSGAEAWNAMNKEDETKRHDQAEETRKAQEDKDKNNQNNGAPMTKQIADQIETLPDDKKALIKQYPSDIQATLYSLANGPGELDFDKIFPGRMYKGSQDMSAQHAIGVLEQLTDGKWSEQNYKTLSAEYKDVTAGKKGDAIEQYNNVLSHSAELQDTLAASSRGKDPEFLNHPLNWLEKHGYGTEAASITGAEEPLKGEYELLMAGGYKPSEEMQKAYDTIISNTATPAQIGAALKKMAATGTVRLENINERYKSISGKNVPNIITPQSLAAAKHLGMEQADPQTWARMNALNSGGTLFQNNQTASVPNQTATKPVVAPPAPGQTRLLDGKGNPYDVPTANVAAAMAKHPELTNPNSGQPR